MEIFSQYCLLYCIISGCLQVYLGYHTFGQVSCGALLGIFLGALWFAVVQLILTPCFPYLASHPIGEFLMLRDSTLIPHVMWFEYTSSRSEARNRQRKVTGRKSQWHWEQLAGLVVDICWSVSIHKCVTLQIIGLAANCHEFWWFPVYFWNYPWKQLILL